MSNSSLVVLVVLADSHAPTFVVAGGERDSYRFLEFITANIRNPNTRRVHARAASTQVQQQAASGLG